MISKELARKVRAIQFHTSKAVNDVLAGEYVSVFKGCGMEFDEVRQYLPGDDIRSIDWNVTARAGEPYVKRFREERELTVIFSVDVSGSGTFGSVRQIKNEAAAEVCALLAFSAIKNNDKVGLLAFTDRVEMFIPPQKGTRRVLRVIREILSLQPTRSGTDLTRALDTLGRVLRKRAVVFLISDFQADGFERSLRVLGRRHDLIAIVITDPRELRLPDAGLLELEDAEMGETLIIDTGCAQVRQEYERLAMQKQSKLIEVLRSVGVDYIPVETGRDCVGNLVKFFRLRAKRRSAG